MLKSILRIISISLVITLLCNMLPMSVLAENLQQSSVNQTTEEVQEIETKDPVIVEEIAQNRSEYTKQFRLSNGLFLSVAYPNAVHYQKDGRWEEIDNTLNVKNGSYTNTAGVWNVRFPQQLSSSEGVVIEKDGYTLSFAITGELRNSETVIRASVETPEMDVDVEAEIVPELTAAPTEALIPQTEETTAIETVLEQTAATTEETMSETVETTAEETIPETVETTAEETIPETEETTIEDTAPPTTEPTIPETVPQTVAASNAERIETESFAVLGAQQVSAQLIPVDSTIPEEYAQHPETIPQKIVSRLGYTNAFSDTNIIYDLQSNTVKESIELRRYQPQLRGYRYTLNTGGMVPVLAQDGSITFYTPDKSQVVMIMPAPFMVDANMNYSHDVQVNLAGKGSVYALTYLLPQDWLADSSRAWPVILDPVVQAQSTVSNIVDQNVYSLGYADSGAGILQCGYVSQVGISRAYLKYDRLPALSNADVIVKAEIRLCKSGASTSTRCVSVHKVLTNWTEGQMQWSNKAAYNTNIEDYVQCLNAGFYTWDVTDIARGWYEGENTGMMFKLPDSVEQAGTASFAQFWSADYSIYQVEEKPALFIYFRNNNGLESYWDYTSSSAGRAGTGHVNDYTGNMVWVHSDIGFGGNRMPVSIQHVYNANDCDHNTFGMGYGWRTNFNQRVYQWPENSNFYVWEDSDGTSHYFYYDSDKGKYVDEDGLELTLTDTGSGNSKYVITDKNGNTTHFDTYGRLTKIQNNQQTKSAISITYTTTSGFMISTVTDGAGRVYRFTYPNNLLDRISFRGSNNTEHSYVTFGYSGSKLIRITDKDTKYCTFAYTGNLLTQAQDIDGYKLVYTYNQTENTVDTDKPNRVIKICEYDGSTLGGEINIEYAHNQTTFTDHNGDVIIKQFNDWGNTVSTQDNEGHAQYAQYAFNTQAQVSANTDATKKGNQLCLSSNMQNTVANLLRYGNMESDNAISLWSINRQGATRTRTTEDSYMGSSSLRIDYALPGTYVYALGPTFQAQPGKTYTLSAYIKSEMQAYMGVTNTSTWGTTASCSVSPTAQWQRVQTTFTNNTSEVITYRPSFRSCIEGSCYVDCLQVEEAVSASRYNLVENGDFTYSLGWTGNGNSTSADTRVTLTSAALLDNNVYRINGDPNKTKSVFQTVNVSGSAQDVYVISGWGKGDSAPLNSPEDAAQIRRFCLKAIFNNTDGTKTERVVSFNPDTDSQNSWQYVAAPAIADKAYNSITVAAVYDYNVNTAYFDGIQLYKEEFGNSYTYDADGNVVSVVDLQKQKTTYEYSNNNLTKTVMPTGATYTYTYDNYHNVKTATSAQNQVYSFEYDAFGNNTKVSITGSGGTISSSAAYSNSGNTLASTTDALGKVTTYGYNAQTNVLEWVQYPEDTADTRTEYTYDSMCRLASAAADTDTGSHMSASYTYTNDLLTRIQTPTTQYNFTYGDFGLRSSVKVGTQALATYHYNLEAENGETPDRNYDLDRLDYGNGDSVNYTYDSKGRLASQTYEDGDTVTYQYDNDGALAVMVDSATGITTRYYYDFLGRTMKYTETATGYSHSVEYVYDSVNNLTTQVETINGVAHTTSYSYDEHNRLASKTTDGITVEYAYDDFGRVVTQTTKNGDTTVLTESYTYKANSTQVATYTTTIGGSSNTSSYTYDDNGNIISESTSSYDIEYVYDSANQLIAEYNTLGEIANTWTYDSAGNITYHNVYDYIHAEVDSLLVSHDYTYGDEQWGDLLTSYDGDPIVYDNSGNPLDDCTWEYTWEHGRELASMFNGFDNWAFTYNADGIRTKRTNGTRTYEYFYNGSQLVQLKVDGNTLFFTYDAQGTPATVTYNGTLYYYITNLQGDVTSIVDANGTTQVAYTYNAYGLRTRSLGDLNSGIGLYNPLRYRGYVFDSETGLYYLQSRYYDPEIGRFINADGSYDTNQGILGHNMYIYCMDNPVSMYDPNGRCSRFLWWKIDCKQASCPESKNYVKPKAVDPIGSYNKGQGYVYIVKEDLLDEIMEDKEDNVVVILDNRSASDPNMQIQDSYRITKNKQQKEIAQLMLDYNTSNPVEPAWSRTLGSLVEEWKLHNFAYNWGIKRERTADCDFNNADEGMGFWDFVGR